MFKKSNRLTHREFDYFFGLGKRSHSPSFQLIYTPLDTLKVGVVVPKKVVKTAVGRNRIRRQLYHLLHPQLEGATGVYIVIVKKTADLRLTTPTKEELLALVGNVIKPG